MQNEPEYPFETNDSINKYSTRKQIFKDGEKSILVHPDCKRLRTGNQKPLPNINFRSMYEQWSF